MPVEKLTARQRMAERLEDIQAARQRVVERLEDISISKLVPSVLTLLGLCCGATAIRFALAQDWRHAVVAIIAAMVFDMLDGRAARAFGADTRFGAQLDSLVDLVSFGVAPGIIVFTWSLHDMGEAGWGAVLVFCACSAIRLARFNIQSAIARDEGATQANPYFTGLPMPAAAFFAVFPLLLELSVRRPFRARSGLHQRRDRARVGADGEPSADAVDQVHAPAQEAVGLRLARLRRLRDPAHQLAVADPDGRFRRFTQPASRRPSGATSDEEPDPADDE